jgi:serine/threonine protein kinase
VLPPVAACLALLIGVYCVLKRRAAYAKAIAPSGLGYPSPLLKAGTAVQDLLPAFEQPGSPAPDAYAVVDGQLPAGLQINKRTGAITGVPAVWGSALAESTFCVRASNLKGFTDCAVTLQVETRAAPADLSYAPCPSLLVGIPVSIMPALRFGIPSTGFRASDLPRGLELNPVTGVISGAARDVIKQCTFTVTAYNDYGGTSCQVALAILEQEAPSGLGYADLAENTVRVLVVGDWCSWKPVFCIGRPEAVFSITPALPKGMTLDAVSGVISGVPLQPMSRGAYRLCLQNQKGKCESSFSLEVQLHIPPLLLQYAAFDQAAVRAQGELYRIFICGELIQPATPDLKQGNHLTFTVYPPLPPGLEIQSSKGIITGRPTAPAKKTVYTVTASNSKGSVETQIWFATCLDYTQIPPNEWSVDQVQVWAQKGLNMDAKVRENLFELNGQKLISLRSLEALRSELPRLLPGDHRLMLFGIENLDRDQQQPLKTDRDDVTRMPLDARHGDPASKSVLPVELRGVFDPICVLGNGGFGIVIQAGRVVKGHIQYHVAIKIFYSDRPFTEIDVKRMNREAALLGRIDSPHVVKLKGNGISESSCMYWLIMDFLDGKNLQELIEAQRFFNEDEVCEMAVQILLGLEAIHALGVVHCDVKPANIMQCAGAVKSRKLYKLVDLGVAVTTVTSSASLAATMGHIKSLRGTPGYISPEIIRNEAGCIGPQADIWSLAATMFEVLTGLLPFCIAEDPKKPLLYELMAVANNLDEEPPDVAAAALSPISGELGAIVRRALWKRRKGRYASAEEMHAVLRAHMDDPLPSNWTPGRQTLRVALDPLQAEYLEVAAIFQASLDPAFPVAIQCVERVQNPSLWALYQVKKRDMEMRGAPGHGERWLYHGTDEATVPKIVSTAFNRSYCGKNATLYGEGVYFARDAGYSARETYSEPNARGEKHVFFCRVLVGAYTLGDGRMRVPPARADRDGTYDTTVDSVDAPSIFVVYHDAQAPRPAARGSLSSLATLVADLSQLFLCFRIFLDANCSGTDVIMSTSNSRSLPPSSLFFLTCFAEFAPQCPFGSLLTVASGSLIDRHDLMPCSTHSDSSSTPSSFESHSFLTHSINQTSPTSSPAPISSFVLPSPPYFLSSLFHCLSSHVFIPQSACSLNHAPLLCRHIPSISSPSAAPEAAMALEGRARLDRSPPLAPPEISSESPITLSPSC